MNVWADTSRAQSEIDELVKQVETANPHMAVTVDVSANAAEIRSIVEDAVSDALSSVVTTQG